MEATASLALAGEIAVPSISNNATAPSIKLILTSPSLLPASTSLIRDSPVATASPPKPALPLSALSLPQPALSPRPAPRQPGHHENAQKTFSGVTRASGRAAVLAKN